MSLQVWLPLNGDLHNQGIKNINVVNNGATVNNNGKIGKCYSFNGSSNKIINTLPSTISSSVGSLACWIKMNSLPGSSSFYNLLQLGDLGGYAKCRLGLYMEYTNYINISIDGSSTGTNRYTHSMIANQWYHLCVTYDGTIVKLYINGNEVFSQNASKGSYTAAVSNFYIGGTSSYYLNGYINDVRYYNHALNSIEVKEIAKGLILHYPLNRSNYGQENLLLNSNIEKSGKSNVAQWFRWNLNNLILTTNVDYTLSFDAKISNSDVFYIGFANNDATQEILAQGVSATTEYKRYTFTKQTSKTNINSILISNYKGYGRGNNNNTTGILYVKNIKLEIGNKNTPWCPNSSEILYNTLGLNNNIQYDISGYQNNGTKHNITYDSDTPKYDVSSIFKSADASYIKINENNWISQGTEKMTINLWVNPDTSFSKFFSCTESGGWNTEAGSSGYLRFPVHVYTNQAKTSTAYKYDSKQLKISDIPLDEWTMITFVYDKTGTRTYINGQLHHTYLFTSYGIHYNTNARLFLGCEASTASPASPYLNGKMSDFRIYVTVLSAEDILSLYNNEAEIDQSGIIHGQIR